MSETELPAILTNSFHSLNIITKSLLPGVAAVPNETPVLYTKI